MNQRERYRATAEFGRPDRAFLLPPWMWDETLARWRKEGLPEGADLPAFFETDHEADAPLRMQGIYGPHLHPGLERQVLSETNDYTIVRDEEGNTVKLFRDDPTRSMPAWIAYPMKDRADWETVVKPRLNAKIPGRHPQGEAWRSYVEEVKTRDYPLGIWCGSFYGWPRSFLGVEQISTLFYDDPGLIHEMCSTIADFVIELIAPLLKDVQFDLAYIWEDMAGKAGPLCSPRTYREFMLPSLKRVTELLHQNDVHTIIVDSDGNNDALIPLWLEAGVTGLRPFEIAANCDPVAIRRKYGQRLVIQGGIDKRALAKDRRAIEQEVLSRVPWLCLQGGYFPQVDHLVPPDVSLENYQYYSQLLHAVVEDPERSLYDARRKGYWKDDSPLI
jgi:uroporphyrinogen decarboxylase